MNPPPVLTKEAPETDAATPQAAPPEPAASRQNRLIVEVGRVLVSVAIIAAGVFGFLQLWNQAKPAEKSEKTGESPVLVDTIEIVDHEGDLDLAVDGVTVPFREIQIAAEVAGRVTFKSSECRAGNFVRAGTLLLRIDQEPYELEVARLSRLREEAAQNVAEVDIEIRNTDGLIALAEDDLELRVNEVGRQKRLRSTGVGSVSELENAERAKLQSENAKQGLENQKRLLLARKERLGTSQRLAEIQLQQAELDLKRTEITAPVDGVLVSEMVEANSFVQRGTGLLVLEDTSQVEVRCSLTMEELYRLWQSTDAQRSGDYDIPNARVTVIYELAGRTFEWEGRLARFDGLGLDEKTRTVPCRIVVSEPRSVRERITEQSLVTPKDGPRALVRGMFVRARIHTTPTKLLVRVPEAALRPGNKVWLVENGQLVVRKAVIAGLSGTDVLVDGATSELAAGDRAIVSPLAASAGMAVKETAE